MRFRLRITLLAAAAGFIGGLATLALLVLPFAWEPMGSWGTFQVFALFFCLGQTAAFLLVLWPFTAWLTTGPSSPSLLVAALVGASAETTLFGLPYLVAFHGGGWYVLLLVPAVAGATTTTAAVLTSRRTFQTALPTHSSSAGA